MRIAVYKGFKKNRRRLQQQGGIADAVYSQVAAAIENWKRGQPVNLQPTHHGESRLKHCVKYQLKSAHRLVTIEHEGCRTLLAVGSHDDIDKWLDSHQGCDFVVDGKGNVELLSTEPLDPTTIDVDDSSAYSTGPILDRLNAQSVDKMMLPAGVTGFLESLTFEKLEDESTWLALNAMGYASDDQKDTVLKVLDFLRKGLREQAEMQISLFAEEAVAAANDPGALIDAIGNRTASDKLADVTDFNRTQIEDMFRRLSYADWLLYLNFDQEKLVKANHKGPARVVGVSGSGKTCVMVHRARELARRYPKERILVLVLNESLKYLIQNLVQQLCTQEEAANIQVKRIYEYCYEAVKTIEPSRLIESHDPLSGETLEACWHDFTLQTRTDRKLRRLVEPLKAPLNLKDVDEWEYLRDELIWVRTGFQTNGRNAYQDCERVGRGIKFPRAESNAENLGDRQLTNTGFPADTRTRILRILESYEEYMQYGGLLDEDGVALKACEVSGKIQSYKDLTARAVLVDEVQDCSTTQLSVIAKIPTDPADGLYLVGDPVQKVFPKQHNLQDAGINVRGRSTMLRANYRNTRQVLEASYQIIQAYRGSCPVPESEILSPEYALREGPRPKLIICSRKGQQAACLEQQISMVRDMGMGTMCAATITNDRLAKLKSAFDEKGWKSRNLTTQSTLDDIKDSIMLSHFDEMKGHEFRFVYLLDLGARQLQLRSIPKEERWRTAFQLYVAMTRAQDELWLFSNGEASDLIKSIEPYVDVLKAEQLLDH